MRQRIKYLWIVACVIIVSMMLISCSGEGENLSEQKNTAVRSAEESSEDSWAIYWYMCGSDLESENGFASYDLEEMMEVSLPDNVSIIIQTGGSAYWNNDFVDPESLCRYLYNSDGLYELEQLPSASMGESETLQNFLQYASENYPADHVAVTFWNHGGGSVLGVCMDELYDGDLLTLNEMYDAFSSVYEVSMDNPPIELVGFDACLMATVDTAYTFCDVSRYLVASEESEPGTGWNYTGWLSGLAGNTKMDGAQLGKIICDSYAQQCQEYEVGDEITLSVIDLGKTQTLFEAYDALGKEALTAACENPHFFASFGRCANKAENYGGNTPDQGYTNMVDLYDLVYQSQNILPENAEAVMSALTECVVYKVNGPYRTQAAGLSAYYSYNGDEEDYQGYCEISASDAFTYLYGYEIDGTLSEDGMAYIEDLGYEELMEVPTFSNTASAQGDEEYPVFVDDDGYAVMKLDPEVINLLKGVYFQLFYMDEEEDVMLLLGRDNDIDMDWNQGVFKDNFRGVWGSIDGYLCYLEIVYEGDDYNLYSVPVLLNGEEYNLRVVYDYTEEEYSIIGARKGLETAGGVADRNLLQLRPGDQITTIHYVSSLTGDDEFEPMEIDTFTVAEDTRFYETDLGDGEFLMYYELEDIRNSTSYSQTVLFTVEDGEIYTETY